MVLSYLGMAQAGALPPCHSCFVTSPGAGASPATAATSSASSAMTAPWAHARVRSRSRGLFRCFLGLGRNGNSGGQPQSPPGEEQDVGGAGSTGTTMRRRDFVVTPHHHGNIHLEDLLNLAGREKEEFAGALLKLEHHMQLEVAEALIFNIRCVLLVRVRDCIGTKGAKERERDVPGRHVLWCLRHVHPPLPPKARVWPFLSSPLLTSPLSLSLPPKTHSKYTNGGMLPSADGSLPKLRPEQRDVVTEYIPEVMRIMDRLEQQGHHHRDARVALYATEALSYEVSTKSVVKAART